MKTVILILMSLFLMFSQTYAQQKSPDKIQPNPPKEKVVITKDSTENKVSSNMIISPDYLYNIVIAVSNKGEVKNGFFIGADTSGIYLLVKGKTEMIKVEELSFIKLSRTRKYSSHGLTGGLWGLLFGNIIFWKAENQPTVFLRDYRSDEWFGYYSSNLAFAAAGIGFGYLAGAIFEPKESIYNFSGNTASRKQTLNRLIDAIKGSMGESKFHFSLTTAKIYTGGTDDYQNMLKSSGFFIYDAYNNYYLPTSNAVLGNINLVRKIQFTYSLQPEIELGMEFQNLGLPNIFTSRSSYYNNSGTRVTGQFYATGYYAVANYSPFKRNLPDIIDWNIGCGLGIVNVDFSSAFTYDTTIYYGNLSKSIYDHQTAVIKKSLIGAEISTELKFIISSAATLGINLNYILIPSVEFPKMSTQAGILRKAKLSPGGFTLGVSLGFYY